MDSFLQNHQSALDSQREDDAIQYLQDTGVYPDPNKLINLTEEQSYDMIKLYDILRDMDFELTENQDAVFMKILDNG